MTARTSANGLHTPKWSILNTASWPEPWQFGQVSTRDPGSPPVPWQWSHSSWRCTSISIDLPKAASSKEISNIFAQVIALFEGLVVGVHHQTCLQKMSPKDITKIRQLDHRNLQSLLGNHRRQRRLLVWRRRGRIGHIELFSSSDNTS